MRRVTLRSFLMLPISTSSWPAAEARRETWFVASTSVTRRGLGISDHRATIGQGNWANPGVLMGGSRSAADTSGTDDTVDALGPPGDGDLVAPDADGPQRESSRHRPGRLTSRRLRPNRWWLDASALVAFVALVISLLAAWRDSRNAEQRERLAARTELSELIRRINELPREEARFAAAVGPVMAQALGGSGTGNQFVLLGQVDAILSRFPRMATAMDLFVIGEAHQRIGEYDMARSTYERGVKLTDDPTLALAFLRGLGFTSIQAGEVEAGRGYYERAVGIRATYPKLSAAVAELTAVSTRLQWAMAELAVGGCAEAVGQIAAIDESARQSPNKYLYIRPIGLQIESTIGSVRGLCPSAPLVVPDLEVLATTESLGRSSPPTSSK